MVSTYTGRLAQLEERLLYTQEVGGSIPSPPTSDIKELGHSLGYSSSLG